MSFSKQHNEPPGKAIEACHNEAFDSGFYSYFKNLKDNKISQLLNSKERKVTFETISYRQLNSWEQQGLLNGNREGREWRRFSVMDALWVKIIDELRTFGMSWERIKVAKESLSYESKKCGVEMPLLEFYTAFAIGCKMTVLLLIFKDGIAVPCSATQYKVAKEIVGITNHIQISLNDLLQEMFPEVDLRPNQKVEMPIDIDEMEILAFLRVGDFEKVEIKYKGGKIDLIEGTEREITQRVHDVINEKCYEEIKIRKRDDGVVTSIVRTRKKKLGN
ncbi:MAG: MerR family transcriptional regulator [Ferruginibacter sp.]